MNSCALSDKGIVRRQNQDSYYAICDTEHDTAVLVVCDGMGGAKAGSVASDLARKVFTESLKDVIKPDMPPQDTELAMTKAVQLANTAVFELSEADSDCSGMGTTLVAAVVVGKNMFVLNVGDSRAYLITKDGISQITRDHSVVEDMIERGNLTREESKNHPNKNLITRAVGTSPDVACDLFSFEVEEGDYLLLCSDGLSNLVSDEELLDEIKKAESLEACCESMIRLAVVRGAPDNITLVLFKK